MAGVCRDDLEDLSCLLVRSVVRIVCFSGLGDLDDLFLWADIP